LGTNIRGKRCKSQLFEILKEEIHSTISGKAGRAVSFDHLVCFIKNVIQAAEDLEVRGNVEGYGGIKEGVTPQRDLSGWPG